MRAAPSSVSAPAAAPAASSPVLRRRRRRAALGLVGLGAALLLAVALSLMIGSNSLPLPVVLEVLRGGGDAEARYVVAELRVPRTVAGLAVGAALGAAGALIQAFTRNPLADPGILGVNAGAAFAVALGVALLGLRDVSALLWLAFLGALVVTVAVYLIGSSGRGAADPIRLTLAGVALGAVFSGVTTGMTLSDPDAFDHMRSWNAGSLLGRGFDVIGPVLPFLVLGVLGALLLAPGLNALALGDDVARAQGARVRGIRLGVIAAVTVLAGAATALAGPIGFVGLMVPHVARWLLGVDQRVVMVISVLLAPVVVLLSDVLGRVLIVLARRRRASTL